MNLEYKIISQELASLISKCLNWYIELIKYADDRSFWEFCPEYFSETQDEMKSETDYIHMFLTLPPNENKYGNISQWFIYEKGYNIFIRIQKKIHELDEIQASTYQVYLDIRSFCIKEIGI